MNYFPSNRPGGVRHIVIYVAKKSPDTLGDVDL
jgi:hypothetical protein